MEEERGSGASHAPGAGSLDGYGPGGDGDGDGLYAVGPGEYGGCWTEYGGGGGGEEGSAMMDGLNGRGCAGRGIR